MKENITILSDMIRLEGGPFVTGNSDFNPEVAPLQAVEVGPFRMDVIPVIDAQFAVFAADTAQRARL